MSDLPTPDAALRSSIRTRVSIGLLLTGLLGLAASVVLIWPYRAAPPTPLQAKTVVKLSDAPQGSASVAPQKRDSSAEAFPEYEQTRECVECTLRRVSQRLTNGLKPDFPELAAILIGDALPDANKVYATLLRLLETSKNAPSEHRPVLLLAADLVAQRVNLPNTYPPTPDVQRKLDELASYGVTFRWSEMGGDYGNQRDLLWRVWRDYPATPAGEDAFALLLDTAWDTTACCEKGSDAFRNVIREGEQFLASRANSPRRLDVEFAAAEAYETWWSLSRAPAVRDNEADPSPDAYREGAEGARAKAIAYYEDIARSAPDSTQTKCSRKSLEMLRQNKDTHQRRFFCYCD